MREREREGEKWPGGRERNKKVNNEREGAMFIKIKGEKGKET